MLVLNTIEQRTRAGGGERLGPNATPSINSAYLMDAVASDDVLDEAYAWLTDLEDEVGRMGLFFVRYMDDWIVLAPTRWKLRRAVRRIREIIAGLGLELAPDKTFVGRVERGFDFLGYHFAPEGVGVAEKTVGNFLERRERLEAQQAGPRRINEYVTRFSLHLREQGAGQPTEVGLSRALGTG